MQPIEQVTHYITGMDYASAAAYSIRRDKKMKLHSRSLVLAALLGSVAGVSNATPITVTSYSMINGTTGSFNYRDFSYSNCVGNTCNASYAPLSGGTGKLTDGIIPTLDWHQYGQQTPYVGWSAYDPVITFNFSGTTHIDSVSFVVDNTPGYGDVRLPDYVMINNTQHQINADTTWGPHLYTFSGLNLDVPSLGIQFVRDQGRWMMLGEVSFDNGQQASNVPEPASLALFGIALAGLAGSLRRRKLHES